jgi:MFS family permease
MLRYRLLLLLCAAAVIAYVQRASLSVPLAKIASDLSVADVAKYMGWVPAAWYFGYSAMQIPSGWFADRAGSRMALAILCSAWSLLTLLTGFVNSYEALLVTWGLMGAAQAGIFPCSAKAVAQTFPDLERARASGLLAFGMYIGTAMGPLVTGQLLGYFSWPGSTGWRLCMVLFALPGLLWSLVFLEAIKPRELPATTAIGEKTLTLRWTELLTSQPLVLLFSQQFLRAGAMVFFVTWFPVYLQKTRGVSIGNSGLLTFYAALGGMLGSLLGGFASDAILKYTGNRRLSRQGIAVVGTGACALLALASYFIADERLAIGVISLGTFCATFGGVSAYTMAIELGGKQVTTVFSTMNMCGNIGAMMFPLAVGWLVSASGQNWHLALFLFAAIMAVAAALWAVLVAPDPMIGEKHAAR